MPFKISLFDTEYDCIGTGCLSLDYIRYQLELAQGQDIEIDISSGGGSAFDAVAIYHLLKSYRGVVNTNNVSFAGSAASTIFAAGSKRTMSKYALLMIHPASSISEGDSNELIADAAMLAKVTENIIAIWVDVTKQPVEKITELVNATTWLTADEALSLGFITDIEDYTVEDAEIVRNAGVVLNQVAAAPVKYKQVINKILIKPEPAPTVDIMTKEEKAALEAKNEGFFTRVKNWFKPSIKEVSTNKGKLFVMNTVAVGSAVFNDADMDSDAEDAVDLEVTDDNGKKAKMTVKDGKISNIEQESDDDDDDEDKDDDTDPDNKAVLAAHNIKVTNKTDRKSVINSLAGKLKEVSNKVDVQNSLILDLKNQLATSNEAVKKRDEDLRDEIKSEFTPESSKRSSKAVTVKNEVPKHSQPKEGSIAANAAKRAISSTK